ncbi:NAD(P)-binding protein [Pseudarthrobacter sp. J75]|uniref:NAD(P)-binding protein n=1 Tax=unclassified Pseudarthrobacter TaxID=2647000 RepID=UPI002E80254D|nr:MULTISPECIES: NAD(P)-binding protein [unclassified Pseudarthrobacter]MEE2523502.1 NAD(P)-binding protein [Pseudarthrobacter sp. J47]MEE2530477.1 NAD(P)-binding protein [Pseudarthrobacter sp. J75]MEE2570189.1 NAD(P)-binding protein [Pseudarthrobacter sp. J64]
MPVNGTERTGTVVIGTGLSGLAVASELRRRGVEAIVVDGLDAPGGQPAPITASLPRCDSAASETLIERNEILRHLRNYAASHDLDIRNATRASHLNLLDAATGASTPPQWEVHTATGILLADTIVLTRCAQSQLRRMLADLGVAVGQNLVAALRAIGLYLVGVGDLIVPSPKEVLRQAKTVSKAISGSLSKDPGHPVTQRMALPAPA